MVTGVRTIGGTYYAGSIVAFDSVVKFTTDTSAGAVDSDGLWLRTSPSVLS